jgi:D-glycero-D-manno-heptose 1,7-bisphosphate phosphatase
MRHTNRPTLLVDRDGTLIEEGEYMKYPRQVKFLPDVYATLRKLRAAGFPVVVVSNQSGVGRGLISLAQLKRVNATFLSLLKKHKAPISGLYWCPHAPSEHCPCRKPKLGMPKQAARELGISWRKSISIGDRPSDVLLGQRTGGQGILVKTGYGASWARRRHAIRPDATVNDFKAAAAWILRQERKKKNGQ